MYNVSSENNINVSQEKVLPKKFSPKSGENSSGENSPQKMGRTANGENADVSSVVEKCKKLVSEGWTIRIRKKKGTIYVSARKTINGKRREIYISKVTDKEVEELKKLGLLETKKRKQKRKTSSRPPTANTTTLTRRPAQGQTVENRRGESDREGVGGSAVCGVGRKCFGFLVHRLGLRFVRGWVVPVFLHRFGRVRFVGRSKQWVVRLGVGVGRWLTLQVNRDGTAQVFLEASENPLGVEEFVGFCRFFLLWLFREVTGREVGLGDFVVMSAPEFNVDLDGVNLLEGLGARSLTLEKYLSDVVRVYYSDPGVKATMPNGGTRVEARADSWRGRGLKEVVEGVASMARLPLVLEEIKKDLELVKSGLPLRTLETNQLAEAVASRLANLIYLTFEKWGNRMELALKQLGEQLQQVLVPVFEKLEKLEKENAELKKKLGKESDGEELEEELEYRDLPENLRKMLAEMEKDKYVRITRTRIAYGDRVWSAIFRYKTNIDWWIDEESLNYPSSRRRLFKNIIKAIRFHDNRWKGKPGIPYSVLLETLKQLENQD